ncbi:hypothetical protein [Paraburkholderia sediminicola]|uniref:hypothetical protein n=1 Tax=Paraburkholderia sediminicola TaxID=458836 RepID=UPI0038BA1B2C
MADSTNPIFNANRMKIGIFAIIGRGATRYSAVYETPHAPTIHPILAAKQTSTNDVIPATASGLMS